MYRAESIDEAKDITIDVYAHVVSRPNVLKEPHSSEFWVKVRLSYLKFAFRQRIRADEDDILACYNG